MRLYAAYETRRKRTLKPIIRRVRGLDKRQKSVLVKLRKYLFIIAIKGVILQILSRQPFLYTIILNHFSVMHFCTTIRSPEEREREKHLSHAEP